ncbi:MAG: hypothetical protein V1775_06875, partial [Bacteroidota bacterium]
GVAPAERWEAPAQKAKIEKEFRLLSKNGQFITLPRVSFYAKLDYKLAPSGIAKIVVVGTVMTPTGVGIRSIIKGPISADDIPDTAIRFENGEPAFFEGHTAPNYLTFEPK